jgi:hypothetical protein
VHVVLLKPFTIRGRTIRKRWIVWLLGSTLMSMTPVGCCLTAQLWSDGSIRPEMRSLSQARVESSGAVVLTFLDGGGRSHEMRYTSEEMHRLEPPIAKRIPRLRKQRPTVSAGRYDFLYMGEGHLFALSDSSVGRLPAREFSMWEQPATWRAMALTPLSFAGDVLLAPLSSTRRCRSRGGPAAVTGACGTGPATAVIRTRGFRGASTSGVEHVAWQRGRGRAHGVTQLGERQVDLELACRSHCRER